MWPTTWPEQFSRVNGAPQGCLQEYLWYAASIQKSQESLGEKFVHISCEIEGWFVLTPVGNHILYCECNGHVTDDVVWHQTVKVMTTTCFWPNCNRTRWRVEWVGSNWPSMTYRVVSPMVTWSVLSLMVRDLSVCLRICRLSHSCTLLKTLDGNRRRLVGTLVWSKVTLY